MLPSQGGEGKCPHIPHADLPSPGTVIQQKNLQLAGLDAEEGKDGLGVIACVVPSPSITQLEVAAAASLREGAQPGSPSPRGERGSP